MQVNISLTQMIKRVSMDCEGVLGIEYWQYLHCNDFVQNFTHSTGCSRHSDIYCFRATNHSP